jgi:hypothetical protein
VKPAERVPLVAMVCAVLSFGGPRTVIAQDTTQVRVDSLVVSDSATVTDSLGAMPDSLPALDSAAAQDSLELQVGLRGNTLPIPELEVPPGPLPHGSRYSFTRDSILWSGGLTLADLLAQVPGAYVLRAGFVGLPEYVQYGSRGGAALEVYWDGLRWLPLGGDTAFVDPGQFPLTYVRRVDIEVLPGLLRVHLASERHETPSVRSKIRVQSGAFKSAQYAALFQKHSASGFSLDLAGNFIGTDGPLQAAGADAFEMWLALGWLPSPRYGARWQVRRQNLDRDGVAGGVPQREGARTDMQFSMFAQSRDDGLGLRAEAAFGSSVWTADSGITPGRHGVSQVRGSVRYRLPNLSLSVGAAAADARTPFTLEGRAGWVPLRFLVLAGDAGYRRHEGDRTSRWVNGSVGLRVGPFSVAGEGAWRNTVQAPVFADDTALVTRDLRVRAGFDTRWLWGSAAVERRASFAPRPYGELPIIPQMAVAPEATYLVARSGLRPISPLTFSGTFSNPTGDVSTDFQPPQHLRAAITFRSKFWRTFRSGVFDLQVKALYERWEAGSAGLDAEGSPILLDSGRFWEFSVEIELVTFTLFWILRNAQLSDDQYVPGLDYPGNSQFFGASWVFAN